MAVPFHTQPVPSARGFTQTILIAHLHSTDFSPYHILRPPRVTPRRGPDQHYDVSPTLSLHRSQSPLSKWTRCSPQKNVGNIPGETSEFVEVRLRTPKFDRVSELAPSSYRTALDQSAGGGLCRTNASCRDACVHTHRLPFFSAAKARPIVARLIRPAYLRSR